MIKNKLLIISGVNRSGKSLLAPIVSSINNIQPFLVNYNYEQLLQMFYCKKVDKNFCNFFFKKMSINLMFEQFMGRNTNIRLNDFSTIWKTTNSNDIIKKVLGQNITKSDFLRNNSNFYSNFFIHNALLFYNLFNDNFKNYKIINIIRHPIDIIYSWKKKKIHRIFDNKNSIIAESFCVKKDGYYIPYFIKSINIKKYQKYNNFEKIVYALYENLSLEYNLINKFFKKKNILIIDFDKFVSQTKVKIKKIEVFLKHKKSKNTNRVFAQENCPRIVDHDLKDIREKKLLAEVSNEIKKKYELLKRKYNSIKDKYD